MTQTTQDQIDSVRTLCEKLELDPAVQAADVNDWGRFGNFDIHVSPATHTRSTTRQLTALVRKALPAGAHLRQCFSPQAIRVAEHRWNGKRTTTKITGYDQRYWVFDIDFQHYVESGNRFELKSLSEGNA